MKNENVRMQFLAGLITESQYKIKLSELNEDDFEEEDDFDLNNEFKNSPTSAPYEQVLGIVEDYEDEEILTNFMNNFPKAEQIDRENYSDFMIDYIDDMSEVDYIQANWISIFDENIFEKAT